MNPKPPPHATVLIVDDAATVRLYHRSILEPAGMVVQEAANGVEALEKVVMTPFDLYLVDVNMPKLDGYGFLWELRQLDIPQAPAVMISTESEDKDRLLAYEVGASFYLIKPVKPEVLVSVCKLLLGTCGAAS